MNNLFTLSLDIGKYVESYIDNSNRSVGHLSDFVGKSSKKTRVLRVDARYSKE